MRRKLAEWWELWWVKPGEPRLRVNDGDYGKPKNERVPRHSFSTPEAARRRLKFNKWYRVVHVVRYSTPIQSHEFNASKSKEQAR